MNTVGIITSPLTSGHAARGVGFYTQYLLENLQRLGPSRGFNILDLKTPADLASQKVDLVHYPFFDLFYHSLPLIKSVKRVVTIHDATPLKYPLHYPPGLSGWLNLQLQKAALVSVDRVITDSYASLADLVRYLPLPHAKIKLVYLAVADNFSPLTDPVLLSTIRRRYHLPPKFILYVGDLNYNKNLPALIDACLNIDMPLVLVGKNIAEMEQLDLNHPELRHLQPVLPKLSSPLIYRLGFIPQTDKVALYTLATAFCQPSFSEGFGLSVLEAMACGCPVICSSASSLPEVAGDAVRYFDPASQADLFASLEALLKSSALRLNLRRRGFVQVKKFTWTKTAVETLAVYRELL